MQYKLAMAGWSGTSKLPRSTKLFCFLLRSSLAAPLLLGLPRAPIDAAPVPKGAPALLAGAKRRMLDRWNPRMAANVADGDFLHFPAHGRDYTYNDHCTENTVQKWKLLRILTCV
jgi:hypothetical protein